MEEELLPKLAERYGFNIRSAELLHYTTRTLVLLIRTDAGAYVAKSICADQTRLAFILAVEQHLREKGIVIPRTIPMIDGSFIFSCNSVPYAVQEFVEGEPLFITSPNACRERGRLLGSIHAQSLGLTTVHTDARSGLDSWEQTYREELKTIADWRERFHASKQKKHQLIMRSLDYFQQAGIKLQQALHHNAYFAELKAEPLERQFVCHGDFHTGNVLWNEREGRFTIIDWEFTRYDFPSIDLGRLLSIIMRSEKKWNPATFSALLCGYLQANPLSVQQQKLLYLDLAFPHLFERFLRKNWMEDMTEGEIRQFLQREQAKTDYMLRLMNR